MFRFLNYFLHKIKENVLKYILFTFILELLGHFQGIISL